MEQAPYIQIQIDERVFIKDPCASGLGKKVIEHSINLIDTLGFEAFTFAKLAEKIDCTEASIYRYFENKHKLLVYHLNLVLALAGFQWQSFTSVFFPLIFLVNFPLQRMTSSPTL